MEGSKPLHTGEEIIVRQALKSAGVLEGSYNIQKIDAGMTNHLYFFMRGEKKYLIRIPGEGTEYLVNRQQEVEVYERLKERGITEEILYINGENGIKVTKFLEKVHVCNINDWDQVSACIRHLKQFHQMKLQVNHEFNLYKKIEEYEKRCKAEVQKLEGYEEVRKKIMDLKTITSQAENTYCLCHIDPVTDNFLIDEQRVYLIDWEYAAMCDPHIDIAMFCIYSELDKERTDRVINIYFEDCCTEQVRKKIYAYMAASAFLWVLWSEIKNISGENYQEYEKKQYEIAKEFCEYAKKQGAAK